MGYYINQIIGYYEGDQLNSNDYVCDQQRPSSDYIHNSLYPISSSVEWINNSQDNNYDTGLGWKMKTDTNAQAVFTQLATVIQTNQATLTGSALTTFNSSPCPILDSNNISHPEITFSQVQGILAGYGQWCLELWFKSNS